MGPWRHSGLFSTDQEELTYPANAAWNEGGYGAAQLDWFGWCLKDQASGCRFNTFRRSRIGICDKAAAVQSRKI